MATLLLEDIRPGAEFTVRNDGNGYLTISTPDHAQSLSICLTRIGAEYGSRRCHGMNGQIGSILLELDPPPARMLAYRVLDNPVADELIKAVECAGQIVDGNER